MSMTAMNLDIESLNCLKKAFLFQNVSREHLEKLLGGARQTSLKAGRTLFEYEQKATHFYLLKAGAIHTFRLSPDGDEKVFQVLRPGDLVAEAVMFMEPCVYPVYARAKKDSALIAMSRASLLSLCRESNDVSLKILSALSLRLYQNMNQIDQLTLSSAGQRLVSYLLEVKRHQGADAIRLPLSQAMLAARLNVTPETLSRLFQGFRKKALIAGRRGRIVLKDTDGLRRAVNLPVMNDAGLAGATPAQTDPRHEYSECGCCNLGEV